MNIRAVFNELHEYNKNSKSIEHRERSIKLYFYLCSIIASISNIAFFPIDVFSNLDNQRVTFATRILAFAALMLNMAVGLLFQKRKSAFKLFINSGFFLEFVYLTILTIFAGGLTSNYWVGYCMILVFWFAQPFSFLYLTVVSMVFTALYHGIVILAVRDTSLNSALISIFFVMGMTLLGCINSMIANINSLTLYKKERAIEEERLKSEKLLLNILPMAIAERLKSGETTISEYFEKVSILFADIVGFTNYCAGRESKDIVELLNRIFYAFDKKTEELGLEKIKTIGDGYMVLAGGLKSNSDDLLKTIDLGDYMIQFMSEFSRQTNSDLSIRVGIHIGSVTAGVIGKTKFAFDIWGDTVNTASRMESSGIPMEIHITEDVANYLTDKKRCKYRGDIEIKGKGKMRTYLIERYDRDQLHPANSR